jgi:hypothetical protein
MYRFITLTAGLLMGASALGHHSVIGIYDNEKRFTIDADVRNFELVNPHPLIFVEILAIQGGSETEGFAVGQTWTLEMDNIRELRELGFNDETFIPGDRIRVAVDPSRHTRYRENTLYIRGVEHQREGFIYLHNIRELVPINDDGDVLETHMHRVVN